MAPAEHREVGERAGQLHPMGSPGEHQPLGQVRGARLTPLRLTNILWCSGHLGSRRAQGRALLLGLLRALWWPSLQELEGEECCFPFHSTGAHPTCFVWRAANSWGGLALRASMPRFKGEKKIVLVVVGVKIFPYGTGIARSWFGPSAFWLYCLLSAACREVSRLRVSTISADFSHTCPEVCFKQNPAPACLFAVLLPQPRLSRGCCGARTGTFSSAVLCAVSCLWKGFAYLCAGHACSQIETLPFPSTAAYGML